MVLQRGWECVREEDRPLISCFLSLGKGGALWCCPCFLMSALETTETNPCKLKWWFSFLPTVHFMRLKLFVPKGLPSSFFPLVILSLLLVPLQVLYSPTLVPWSPTLLQQATFQHWSARFSLDRQRYSCWQNPLPRYWRQSHKTMPHYSSNVPSKASVHHFLSSYRGGLNLQQ